MASKSSVSETGLRLALSKGPDGVGLCLPSTEDGNDSISETGCLLVFRNPDGGQSNISH
jgi:hypothetical protein